MNRYSAMELLIHHISEWGPLLLVGVGPQFVRSFKMIIISIDEPRLGHVVDMSYTLYSVSGCNGDLSGWNTVTVGYV